MEENETHERPLRRSDRVRRPPGCVHDMAMVSVDDPVTYKGAMESAERKNWNRTMKEEQDSIKENNRWKQAKLPPGKKAIPCKMIFERTLVEHSHIGGYKAHLVAKGYFQENCVDYDKTFAPVVHLMRCFF